MSRETDARRAAAAAGGRSELSHTQSVLATRRRAKSSRETRRRSVARRGDRRAYDVRIRRAAADASTRLIHDGSADDLPRPNPPPLLRPPQLVPSPVRALVLVVLRRPRAVLQHRHLRQRRLHHDARRRHDLHGVHHEIVQLVLPRPPVRADVLRARQPLLQHRALQALLERSQVMRDAERLRLGRLPPSDDLLRHVSGHLRRGAARDRAADAVEHVRRRRRELDAELADRRRGAHLGFCRGGGGGGGAGARTAAVRRAAAEELAAGHPRREQRRADDDRAADGDVRRRRVASQRPDDRSVA
eukprot:29980-Pelagococcus_subviridis.AAC.2